MRHGGKNLHKVLLPDARKRQGQDSKPGGLFLTAPPRKGRGSRFWGQMGRCGRSNKRKGPKRRWCVDAERGGEGAEW